MNTDSDLTVNGRPAVVPRGSTIADLLEQQRGDRRPHGVAVAVDDEVVAREHWATHPLRDGDVVEVVTAVQGG